MRIEKVKNEQESVCLGPSDKMALQNSSNDTVDKRRGKVGR